MTTRKPTFTARYGAVGRGVPVTLQPVYCRGRLTLWAACDRNEIGIVVVRHGSGWRPWDPNRHTENPPQVRLCGLARDGLRTFGEPSSAVVTDIRPHGTAVVPASTCNKRTFDALRAKVRELRQNTSPDNLVPSWERIMADVSKPVRGRHKRDDVICALRAEGARPAGRLGWRFAH